MAAQLHNHALRLLVHDNGVNVFPKDWLKVQFVGNVGIGRNGFGITINHNRLVASFFGRQHAVNAGIIKLDALPNSVGSRPQNDYFFTVGADRLVAGEIRNRLRAVECDGQLIVKRRVIIRRSGLELSRAGIHAFIHPPDVVILTEVINFTLFNLQNMSQLTVGIAFLFGNTEQFGWQIVQIELTDFALQLN